MDTALALTLAALAVSLEPDCGVNPITDVTETVAFVAGHGDDIRWMLSVNEAGFWRLWQEDNGTYCFLDGGDTLVVSTVIGPFEVSPDGQ